MMNTIEIRAVSWQPDWGDAKHGPVAVLDLVVDGARLLDLVRAAELPYARQEQLERAAEFAPDQAPLLAGDYMCLPVECAWPSRHLLGEPLDIPWSFRAEGETMLFGCPCGINECWALMARIEVTGSTVRWSGFRNTHRDWDLSALGPFTFSRREYEDALRAVAAP